MSPRATAASASTWSTSTVAEHHRCRAPVEAELAERSEALTTDPLEYVAIGRIGPPRGVRGDVFVEPWTDVPEQRFVPGVHLVTDPEDAGPLVVAAASNASGRLVVHFDGVEDRDAVETLRGVRLLLPATDRPPLEDPEEFYDSDLVGLAAHAPDGVLIGTVTDVVHAASATYLVVGVDGRDRLVPFVAAIVPDVDVPGGRLVVDAPEGLFEL